MPRGSRHQASKAAQKQLHDREWIGNLSTDGGPATQGDLIAYRDLIQKTYNFGNASDKWALDTYNITGRESSLLQAISTYDEEAKQDQLHDLLVPGTCEWIRGNSSFTRWLENDKSATLVMTGIVGSGKSMLVSAVIDYLRKEVTQDETAILWYYFDSSVESSLSSQSFLRSILKQIIRIQGQRLTAIPRQTQGHLKQLFSASGFPAQLHQLMTVLQEVTAMLDRSCIVVDGLQELHDDEISKVLASLKTLISSHHVAPRKLILTMREKLGANIDIRNYFPGLETLHLSIDNLRNDIDNFIECRTTAQSASSDMSIDRALMQDIKRSLRDNGERMYVYQLRLTGLTIR